MFSKNHVLLKRRGIRLGSCLPLDCKKTLGFHLFCFTAYRDNDDDDIIDVAAMGGVNLSEESKNILAAVPETSGQLRSCRDDILLSHTPLASKIRKLGTQLIHSVKYKVVDFL